MFVKCTRTHHDVTEGGVYEVFKVYINGVDIVADDQGDKWFLLNEEFEVVVDE